MRYIVVFFKGVTVDEKALKELMVRAKRLSGNNMDTVEIAKEKGISGYVLKMADHNFEKNRQVCDHLLNILNSVSFYFPISFKGCSIESREIFIPKRFANPPDP